MSRHKTEQNQIINNAIYLLPVKQIYEIHISIWTKVMSPCDQRCVGVGL